MKRSSWQRVDLFWREVFGVDPCAGAIVEHGAMLGGFDGVLVVVRRGAALISAPARMHGDIARWRPTAEAAASATWWRGRLPGWEVRGPSVHAFLDRSDQLPATTAEADVRVARMEDLTPLRERVPAEEWSESGFAGDDVAHAWAATDQDGVVLAASNLTPFGGVPADVGLLVDPAERGRGLGRQVGAVAAQVAVDRHGIARWRAVVGNHGSRRIAERLGFEPDCLQLAVVPVDGLA